MNNKEANLPKSLKGEILSNDNSDESHSTQEDVGSRDNHYSQEQLQTDAPQVANLAEKVASKEMSSHRSVDYKPSNSHYIKQVKSICRRGQIDPYTMSQEILKLKASYAKEALNLKRRS